MCWAAAQPGGMNLGGDARRADQVGTPSVARVRAVCPRDVAGCLPFTSSVGSAHVAIFVHRSGQTFRLPFTVCVQNNPRLKEGAHCFCLVKACTYALSPPHPHLTAVHPGAAAVCPHSRPCNCQDCGPVLCPLNFTQPTPSCSQPI